MLLGIVVVCVWSTPLAAVAVVPVRVSAPQQDDLPSHCRLPLFFAQLKVLFGFYKIRRFFSSRMLSATVPRLCGASLPREVSRDGTGSQAPGWREPSPSLLGREGARGEGG